MLTVKLPELPFGLDLELPADVEVEGLLKVLMESYPEAADATGAAHQVEAHPPGRVLSPSETLAAAGVWDGAWLIVGKGEV